MGIFTEKEKNQEFKFKISLPLQCPDRDNGRQFFSIFASYPNFCYEVLLKGDEEMAKKDQIRLAVLELKMRLIQEISNAQFELEKA